MVKDADFLPHCSTNRILFKEYGKRYCNIRENTVKYSVIELIITETQEDKYNGNQYCRRVPQRRYL